MNGTTNLADGRRKGGKRNAEAQRSLFRYSNIGTGYSRNTPFRRLAAIHREERGWQNHLQQNHFVDLDSMILL